MAEVGVLELQIRDNAAEAGSGLDQLAGALGRVKNAIPGNKSSLGLSKVGTELNSLARQINGAKSGTATIIKNVTALFNSISGLGKLKRIDLDTTPIDKIKNAIGDGLNLGNTGTQLKNLRDAFSKPWDASGAVAAMGSIVEVANTLKQEDTVGKISAVATALSNYSSAITKYTKAYKDLPKSNDKMEAIIQNLAFGISKGQIEEQQQLYEEATAQARENWEKSGRHGIPLDLQFHAGKGKETTSAGQIMMDLDRLLGPAVEETTNLQDAFVKVDKSVGGANIQLVEFKDTITSIDTTGMDRLSKTFDSLERKSGAVRSIADMTKEVDEAMEYMDIKGVNFEAYNKAIDSIFEYLEGKIKYTGRNGIQRFIDAQMGIGNKSTKGENYYKNIFPVDMLEEAAKPLTDGSMEKAAQDTVSVAGNLAEKASEISDDIKAIIPYNENIENSWENIARGISEAARRAKEEYARACEEAIAYNKRLNEEIKNKYRSYGQTIESIYSGNGSFSAGLRGELGPKTQEWAIDDVAKKFGMTADEVRAKIEQMKAAAEAATQSMDDMKTSIISMQGMQGFDTFAKFAEMFAMWNKMRMGMSLGDGGGMPRLGPGYIQGEGSVSGPIEDSGSVSSSFQSVKDAINNAGQASEETTNKLKDLDKELKQKKTDAHGASSAFKTFKKAMDTLFPTLTNLIRSFKRIAMSRLIRSVIRSITAGFKTGLENVYNYSKAIGSDFAPAMDSAASSLLTMKNSLGAALAPLLQSLIPVLQTVVNWFITAVNYINQFFALLNGQATWTRALPATTTAFNKQEKAAKGAAAAVKDLLADWDELNIIQSETSGAGSGAGTSEAEDYLNMFEEVSEFDRGVKDVVKFLKENFAEILVTAVAIKAALAAWKLSQVLSDSLPFLSRLAGGIAIGATIGISIAVTDILGKAYIDTGEPGYLIADALSGAVGATIAGQIASRLAGQTAGSVTAGFTLILEGIVNIKNAVSAMHKKSEAEAWALGALGAIEAGIGTALIRRGLFGLTAGGTIVDGVMSASFYLALTAIALIDAKNAADYKTMAYRAFAKTGENGISPQAFLTALQSRFTELTSNAKLVADVMLEFDSSKGKFKESIEQLQSLNTFLTSGTSLTEAQAEEFKKTWDIVFEELKKLGEMSYESVFLGLEQALQNGTKDIKNAATELKTQLVEIAKMTGGARAAAEEEMRQYVEELSVGNTEHIDRYLELYNIWGGKDTEDQIKELSEQALKQNIEFSKENPVNDAVDFITQMQESMVKPALEAVNQQYESELKGIEEQREEIKNALKSGYINADQAEAANKSLDQMKEVFDKFHEQQLAEVDAMAAIASDKVAKQLLQGYYDSSLDDQGRQSYIDNVVNPIVEALEGMGVNLPESIHNLLKITEGLRESGVQNTARTNEYAETYGRTETYRNLITAFMAENEYSDMGYATASDVLDYILSHMQETNSAEGYAALNDADKQDIINSLVSVLPDYMIAEAIDELSNGSRLFNGSAFAELDQLLSWINWDALAGREGEKYGFDYNGEELIYSIDFLNELIKELIERNNFNHPDDTETLMRKYGQYGTAGVPAGENVHLDEGDLSSGVQAGTERANAEQNSILREIERVLRLINNKPNTVVYAPNTTAARVNRQSDNLLERVIG